MLTMKKPVLAKVGRSEEQDLYVLPGDGIGFRHMCPWSAKAIWNAELEPLKSLRVWVSGGKK